MHSCALCHTTLRRLELCYVCIFFFGGRLKSCASCIDETAGYYVLVSACAIIILRACREMGDGGMGGQGDWGTGRGQERHTIHIHYSLLLACFVLFFSRGKSKRRKGRDMSGQGFVVRCVLLYV